MALKTLQETTENIIEISKREKELIALEHLISKEVAEYAISIVQYNIDNGNIKPLPESFSKEDLRKLIDWVGLHAGFTLDPETHKPIWVDGNSREYSTEELLNDAISETYPDQKQQPSTDQDANQKSIQDAIQNALWNELIEEVGKLLTEQITSEEIKRQFTIIRNK